MLLVGTIGLGNVDVSPRRSWFRSPPARGMTTFMQSPATPCLPPA